MSEPRDVVIVGGGHNGLVAACLLAGAGLRPLVLERRATPGGCASTEEIHPGFRCPGVWHAAGPLMPDLPRAIDLARHGLEMIRPPVRLTGLSPDGPPLVIYEDPARTSRELAGRSRKDSVRYTEFADSFRKIGRFLQPILGMTPPSVESPTLPEAWRLLRLGKGFRDLGRKDGYRLLRWGPMAVADLASEWFETDLLRAMVAARGIHAAFAGPWSAGTSVGPLFQAAIDGQALLPATTFRGGPGALAAALAAAAKAAGAEIRTGAEVARITTGQERVTGVVLSGGETIPARAVVSGADPKTTFLRLIDPVDLDPDFLHKIRNYRASGSVARISYALSGLPSFRLGGADGAGDTLLSGRIHVGPDVDYLERAFDCAKYGRFSDRPYLDVTIPSVADPTLAPKGAHVMSVHVQYAPRALKEGDWSTQGAALAAAVERTLGEYAPDLASLIVARQVLVPPDLERVLGLAGGHILHGEPSLDQIFTMRPILGWARYRGPVPGLYLCGAGTHPGGGLTGGPGLNAAREILKDLKR